MNIITLLQEATVIGFFIVIITNLVNLFNKSRYTPFIAGALTHIVWEIFGLNEMYCKNRND